MPGIFISYRRDDQAGFAGRLADALVAEFGADNVFRDIEDIHPGDDFVVAIEKQLASVDVMLVVIGNAWLTASRNGVRRLDEPDDFVRREIEAGLASGKMVLPVLVGGATMPAEKELPPSIRALSRRQSFLVSDLTWASDVARLIAAIRPFFPLGRGVVRHKRLIVGGIGVVLTALLAVGLRACFPISPEGETQKQAADGQVFSGRWDARVKYDWGAEHRESFVLRIESGEARGTASYLGVPRTVEDGRLSAGRLEFFTRSQEILGNGPGREEIHRYRGELKQGELHFWLESSGGYSSHPPIEFVARRSAEDG